MMKVTLRFQKLGLALAGIGTLSLGGINAQDEKKEDAAATEEKKEDSAAVAIEVTGNDQMQFDKKAIEAKAGEPIKLVFKNVGKLPKVAMGHNMVILKKGEDPQKFGMAAASAAATDYIPSDMKDKILAHTKLLGPGEEDTITFTIDEPGDYKYLCSFPGHFAMMNGVLSVK